MTIVATVCNILTVTFYKEHALQQHDLIAHSYFEKQILLGCHFPVNLRYSEASCDFPTKNKSLAYMILWKVSMPKGVPLFNLKKKILIFSQHVSLDIRYSDSN